jgi:outer membrane protein assembly factor BamB
MALDKFKGKKHWKQDFKLPFSGAVGYGDDTLFIGTSDGEVLALSAADGSELWRAQLHGEIMAPPQTNGTVVVVQSYDGKLQGLSAADGSEMWVYDSNLPVLTLRGTSTPIIYERLAIAGFGNGKILAFDISNGSIRWEARVAIAQGRSEIDRIVDIDGTMVLVSGTLFAASYQGRLAAIDIKSGRKVWQEDLSSYVGVDQGFGNIYVAEESGTVSAFRRTGEGIRWQQPALSYRRLSAPKAIRGYVAVGDLQGYVHFLSQVDGHFVGRTKVGSDGIRADMLVEKNVLYVFEKGGTLAALHVSSLDKK